MLGDGVAGGAIFKLGGATTASLRIKTSLTWCSGL